ncbi:MAG: FAD-binding oxidoreductase [Candidatus Thermoplasmatota archaeon]
MKRENVINKIEKNLGKTKVSIKETDLYSYPFDFWPITLHWIMKEKYPYKPSAVVWPENAEDVQKIMEICSKEKTPIYPYGGGSGVLGASVPEQDGIVVDLKKMRNMEINDEDLIVEVEPGLNGYYLEDILNHKGYTMGNIPQSLYPSTVGGWVGTKATGQFSTKYGGIEHMVSGVEVVVPPGKKIFYKPHPRTATGPDLRNLFVGSEGIFGIITCLWLKIWPYPEKRTKLSFISEDINQALKSVQKILRIGAKPAVVRIYDKIETKRHFYPFNEAMDKIVTIFIIEGNRDIVNAENQIIQKNFNGKPLGEKLVDHWLQTRFNVKEAAEFVPLGVVFDTIEVGVTWSKANMFYNRVVNRMREVKGVLFASAHASHFYPQGVCFYFTFAGTPPRKQKKIEFYQKVWKTTMEAVLEYGGTISHHHGVGRQRHPWMKEELGENGFELLKKIKNSVDEERIMNPGNMGV